MFHSEYTRLHHHYKQYFKNSGSLAKLTFTPNETKHSTDRVISSVLNQIARNTQRKDAKIWLYIHRKYARNHKNRKIAMTPQTSPSTPSNAEQRPNAH